MLTTIHTFHSEIASHIIKLMPAQLIYLNQFWPTENQQEFIIIIAQSTNNSLAEYVVAMNGFLKDYPSIQYKLFYLDRVRKEIKRGNLFFYLVCQVGNLLHRHSSIDAVNWWPERVDATKTWQQSQHWMASEWAKINAFKDGSHFYWQKENLAQCAFMLQQQIELSYRFLEIAATGRDKLTHSIKTHQEYVKPYFPELGNVFDVENATENLLLTQLDDAYLVVRYGTDYRISAEKLEKIRDKAQLVTLRVAEILEKLKTAFRAKYGLEAAPVEPALEAIPNVPFIQSADHRLAAIIEKIIFKIPVEGIYCFGQRSQHIGKKSLLQAGAEELSSHHYDLLLIGEADKDIVGTVQNAINTHPECRCTVSLLLHTRDYVLKSLKEHNRFFHLVLSQGEMVYSADGSAGNWDLQPDWEHKYKGKAREYLYRQWTLRRRNATGFMDAAEDTDNFETTLAVLYNQALTQTCLGLLQFFLDYHPTRFSLGHLLDICDSFWDFPRDIFSRNTKEEKASFSLLANSANNLLYKGDFPTDMAVILLMGKRCRSFLEKADEMIEAAYMELKEAKKQE